MELVQAVTSFFFSFSQQRLDHHPRMRGDDALIDATQAWRLAFNACSRVRHVAVYPAGLPLGTLSAR